APKTCVEQALSPSREARILARTFSREALVRQPLSKNERRASKIGSGATANPHVSVRARIFIILELSQDPAGRGSPCESARHALKCRDRFAYRAILRHRTHSGTWHSAANPV